MILVTGGTGLVGSHLLYKLVDSDESIVAIYRREKTLSRVKKVFSYYSHEAERLFKKINWTEADITDIPALQKAFVGITKVYHCAAFVSFEPDKYNQLRKINIEGTANIVNLCISNKVEKLCYVSSIAALGKSLSAEAFITEETEWNPEYDNSVYAITKYGAEQEVWRGTQEGVDAVIVNPGIILGPGFWRGGGSGSLIKNIHKGLKYYPIGSSGYVDVWDTVDIMYQLMESSICNQRFIVISENCKFMDFQNEVADCLSVKKANKPISPFLLSIVWRLDWLNNKLFGKRRALSKQMAKSISTISKFDNSKVKKALDYQFEDLSISIKKVTEYFIEDLTKD